MTTSPVPVHITSYKQQFNSIYYITCQYITTRPYWPLPAALIRPATADDACKTASCLDACWCGWYDMMTDVQLIQLQIFIL